MPENLTKRGHIRRMRKFILLSTLIICGGVLFASITWVFHKIQYSLGVELAEVAVTFMSILILILILLGMRAGLGMDRFIRHRKDETCKLCQTFGQIRHILSLLGYEGLQLEPKPTVTVEHHDTEGMRVPVDGRSRRGRPPTYPLARWTKVVVAWENRDTLRNPMTLTEFLCQEFGTHADGSPCISENRFYDYRKIVLEELRKEKDHNEAST